MFKTVLFFFYFFTNVIQCKFNRVEIDFDNPLIKSANTVIQKDLEMHYGKGINTQILSIYIQSQEDSAIEFIFTGYDTNSKEINIYDYVLSINKENQQEYSIENLEVRESQKIQDKIKMSIHNKKLRLIYLKLASWAKRNNYNFKYLEKIDFYSKVSKLKDLNVYIVLCSSSDNNIPIYYILTEDCYNTNQFYVEKVMY